MYSSLYKPEREAGLFFLLLLLLFCISHSQLFQPNINSQLLPDAVTQPVGGGGALFVITAKVCLVLLTVLYVTLQDLLSQI